MALLDFLKKKEEASAAAKAKAGKEKAKAKQPAKVSVVEKKIEKKEKPEVKIPSKSAKNAKSFSYQVVKAPHISEKATYMAEVNQYVFDVSNDCNKNEAKKAISGIYGVDVLSVNMIRIPAKKRRLGKTQGYRNAYKKAIVTIKEGQKIEIL
jgi:large subunit ribosomal protein L23